MNRAKLAFSSSMIFVKHHRVETMIVALFLLLSFMVHLSGINRGLWQDEAYTIMNYVSKGPVEITSGDTYKPNNHMLYSLAAWLIVSLFGFSEIAVRLLAIFPAIAAFFVMYLIVRKYYGRTAGITSLVLLASGAFHLMPTSTARGYGFLLLFSSLFMYFLLKYAEQNPRPKNNKYLILAMLSGFAAFYSYPSYIVFAGITLLVAYGVTRQRNIIYAGSVGVFVAAIALLPLANSIVKYYVNFGGGFKKHDNIEWDAIIILPINKLQEIVNPLSRPIVDSVSNFSSRLNVEAAVAFSIFALVVFGGYRMWTRNRSVFYTIALPPIIFIGVAVILSVPLGTRSDYTIFLEFNLLAVLAVGIAGFLHKVHLNVRLLLTRSGKKYIEIILLVMFFLGLAYLIVHSALSLSGQNKTELDHAKSSLSYASSICKSENCTVAVYASSTSFSLYIERTDGDTVFQREPDMKYRHEKGTKRVVVYEAYKNTFTPNDYTRMKLIKTYPAKKYAKEVKVYEASY